MERESQTDIDPSSDERLDSSRLGRRSAVDATLRAYESLRTGLSKRGPLLIKGRPVEWERPIDSRDIAPNPDGRLPTGFFIREQEVMDLVETARKSRFYHARPEAVEDARDWLSPSAGGERRDALPELEEFSRAWRIAFPVPTNVEIPLEETLISPWTRPVTLGHTGEYLSLEIDPRLGKEVVRGFIGGALKYFLPKNRRERSRRGQPRVRSRKPTAPSLDEILKIETVSPDKLLVRFRLDGSKVRANLGDVLAKVSTHLPASNIRFERRRYYETVFKAVDLRREGLRLSQIAIDLKLVPEKRDEVGLGIDSEIAPYARQRLQSYKQLCELFRIPPD